MRHTINKDMREAGYPIENHMLFGSDRPYRYCERCFDTGMRYARREEVYESIHKLCECPDFLDEQKSKWAKEIMHTWLDTQKIECECQSRI